MRQGAPEENCAPTPMRKDHGEGADDHQLPGAHAGTHDAIGEAGLVGKGAAYHERYRRYRGNPVSHREDDAKVRKNLPWLRQQAEQPHTRRADEETNKEHQPHAERVREPTGKEHAGGGDDEIGGNRQPKRGAADAEVLGYWFEGETDGKSGATADE